MTTITPDEDQFLDDASAAHEPHRVHGPDLELRAAHDPVLHLGPVQPLSRNAMATGAVMVGLVGLGAGLLFGAGDTLLGKSAIMIAAGVVGVLVALLAATRFWFVLVGMFVARASLDALKLGDAAEGSSALDPGVVVGLVFLMAGAGWLLAQKRAGDLRPMSGPTKWFIALAAAGSFSAVGSGDIFSSFSVSLKIWAGALMVAVLEQVYRQNPARVKVILAAGGASLVVPAIVAAQQLASPRQLEAYLEVSRINGTFVHANPFATYLVIIAVVALAVRPHLERWSRVAANVAIAVATALTLFTYARGAWIALILGVIVVGICQDKRLIAAVVAAAVAALLFVPSVSARLSDLGKTEAVGNGDPNSLAWRIKYWERLLPLTEENPATGIGLDQVLARSPEKLMPHNTFVQSLVETGVLGLVSLLGLITSTAWALRDVIRRLRPGLARGIAVGAAAAGLGWFVQLGSENLLTQAAIFWYLAGPIAFVVATRSALRAGELADRSAAADDDEAATEPAATA
ncbi:MAG: O-antigen ligase family protein [Acidimicrobiia bacterium]